MEHTPTPWKVVKTPKQEGGNITQIYGGDGFEVVTRVRSAERSTAKNAAFIVKAVNSHEELLEALKEIVQIELDQDPESRNVQDEALAQYQSIIAKAEGGH
jgi:hypothetical protein